MLQIHETAFIAEGAKIIGDVTIKENASVWYNAVIRGDRSPVIIGKCSNIQDNAVIHEDVDKTVVLGDYVTVGHGAIVHGCVIGDDTTVGMGAIIMNGARIGKNCVIGAGSLVTQNKEIPDGSLVMGSPAKVVRQLSQAEMEAFHRNTLSYVKEVQGKKTINFKKTMAP